MSAAPGTLLQYFKQPASTPKQPASTPKPASAPKKTPKKDVSKPDLEIIPAADTSQSSKRKSDVGEAHKLGKRRKLSLATLREKQADIPAVLTIDVELKENIVTDSNNKKESHVDKLSSTSSSKLNDEKITLKSAKDVLFQNQRKNNKKELNSIKSKESASTTKKKLNANECKHTKVEVKEAKLSKNVKPKKLSNSISKLKPSNKRNESPSKHNVSINVSSSSEEEFDFSKNKSKSKRRSKNQIYSDSDSNMSTIDPSEICSKFKELATKETDDTKDLQDTATDVPELIATPKAETSSRRSSRVRKPVERFVIVSDHDSDDGLKTPSKKKKNKNKGTPKDCKEKNKPKSSTKKKGSDEVVLIADNSKPRKSISSVLGVSKAPKPVLPPRQTSHDLMQEAKRLMSENSKQRVTTPLHNNCALKSMKSVVAPTEVWPKISHVNLSDEIVIYPLKDLVLNAEAGDRGNTVCYPAARFTHPVHNEQAQAAVHNTTTYPECVEELKKVHTHNNIVEDLIEYYRATTRLVHQITPIIQVSERSEDRPWSKIYCPSDYRYCIGNKAPTKQLYKWLDNWKTKLLNTKKNRCSDYSSDESDFVVSGEEEEVRWLDNVVMLAGPCGVGKSGLINTCAKQLGYKVMELNASSERTGKHVAELFSEASQSHSVCGRTGGADFTKIMANIAQKNKLKKERSKRGLDNFFGKKGQASSKEQTDVIDVDKSAKSQKRRARKKSSSQGKLSFGKDKSKKQKVDKSDKVKGDVKVEKLSVIVVEEIDIAFEEDRGFYTAIVALTQVAKRPIILTTNNPNISLPTDAEFLVLNFQPPKVEGVMENLGSLCLAWNNYIPPYCLQQVVQYQGSDVRRLLNHLEFLNVSNRAHLQQIDLTSHVLGITGLTTQSHNARQIVLEQTQEVNLQYVYLNLQKCLKSPKCPSTSEDKIQNSEEKVDKFEEKLNSASRDKRKLLNWLISCDTFIELDLLSGGLCLDTQHQLFPVRASSSLQQTTYPAEEPPSSVPYRAGIENQLLNTLNVNLVGARAGRLNRFKLKEHKQYSNITDTYKSCDSAPVSAISLLSRCRMEELSALRGICRAETVREEAHVKRRFLHYLQKELDNKQKVQFSEFCLWDR